MQAEIPHPISGTAMRWGAFTAPQLGWLAVGAALPYLLLRSHLGISLILLASTPWLGSALVFAFGRCEGRRLDAWTADWLAFLVQPHRLRHPQRAAIDHRSRCYVEVDPEGWRTESDPMATAGSLPWVMD
ncbi:MAG: hypothetical protein WAL64_04145 [Candidatus Dormiibacterota bacterium]